MFLVELRCELFTILILMLSTMSDVSELGPLCAVMIRKSLEG